MAPTRFDIRSEDRALIDAAVRLGEWLRDQPETRPDQRQAIAATLELLGALPEGPASGIQAEFDVEIRRNTPEGDHVHSWFVSVDASVLEIGSIVSLPWPADHIDEAALELWWELYSGERKVSGFGGDADKWIQEVSDLRGLIPSDCGLQVSATYRMKKEDGGDQ